MNPIDHGASNTKLIAWKAKMDDLMIWAGVPSNNHNSDRSNAMKSGTRDEAQGKWHQAKGKVNEVAGN